MLSGWPMQRWQVGGSSIFDAEDDTRKYLAKCANLQHHVELYVQRREVGRCKNTF